MIHSLGQFQENFNGAVTEVKNATQIIGENVHSVNTLSEDTQTAATHISSAVEELAQGAQSMAESVQDVNLKVSDMGDYVADIEGNVQKLSDSADDQVQIPGIAQLSGLSCHIRHLHCNLKSSYTDQRDVSIRTPHAAKPRTKHMSERIESACNHFVTLTRINRPR
jgi:uncharacterized protein YoxC